MIQSVTLHNYGPIHDLAWNDIGSINVIIAPNALGGCRIFPDDVI
jgi:AAA15 family ATPase/GTPase